MQEIWPKNNETTLRSYLELVHLVHLLGFPTKFKLKSPDEKYVRCSVHANSLLFSFHFVSQRTFRFKA